MVNEYVSRMTALAVLRVCGGRPHAKVMGEALLMGFCLVEEETPGQPTEKRYEGVITVEQVNELLPKVGKYIGQLVASLDEAGGGSGPAVGSLAGLSEGETEDILWLAGEPQMDGGVRRPPGLASQSPDGLSEEAMAEIKRLIT